MDSCMTLKEKGYIKNDLNIENEEDLNSILNKESNILNNINLEFTKESVNSSDDDDETIKIKGKKKFYQHLLNSDSEADDIHNNRNKNDIDSSSISNLQIDKEKICGDFPLQNHLLKLKAQEYSTSSSSEDTDSNSQSKEKQLSGVILKSKEPQARNKNKVNKLRQKFQNLISSRTRNTETETDIHYQIDEIENNYSKDFDNVDIETVCTAGIKEKSKGNKMNSNICDPDTSDEEINRDQIKQKKRNKTSKKTSSSKLVKMSPKQAMENMQKIKSESNRMLREKQVSLPYHRPKALSLKDVISRRKPAVAADGKSLPIKMNNDQLQQYVLQLEKRQKEMIELCKSDTDEEECSELTVKSQNTSFNKDTHVNLLLTNKDVSEVTCTDDARKEDKESKSVEENISGKTNIENHSDLEMKLIYNDSVKEANTTASILQQNNISIQQNNSMVIDNVRTIQNLEINTETDNQSVSLYNESINLDKKENGKRTSDLEEETFNKTNIINRKVSEKDSNIQVMGDSEFSNDNMNMNSIDAIIENAEIIRESRNSDGNLNSPILTLDSNSLNVKPKLTGAPGMVIDLEANDSISYPKKLSGIELLKERFEYFIKLKTPEEKEREREKIIKPGTQHLRLKQELEERIAEQRSLEWAKRLEEEKEQNIEINALGECSDIEDDIDKNEAKIEKNDEILKDTYTSESEEEESDENDVLNIKEKIRKYNPLIDGEAEESNDDDECRKSKESDIADLDYKSDDEGCSGDLDSNDEEISSDDETSSESEIEKQPKQNKGRILKAFEDSDDEDMKRLDNQETVLNVSQNQVTSIETKNQTSSQLNVTSQDEELCLAQPNQLTSNNVLNTQESILFECNKTRKIQDNTFENEIHTEDLCIQRDLGIFKQDSREMGLHYSDNLTILSETQNNTDTNLDDIIGIFPGSFSQNLVNSQPKTQEQLQDIDKDVLALCTGKFYDNNFLSQTNDSTIMNSASKSIENVLQPDNLEEKQKITEKNMLESVFKDLEDPEVKPNIFFCKNSHSQNVEKTKTVNIKNVNLKKKFVIESDDENVENDVEIGHRKKNEKMKKLKKRVLQISDDEEEYSEQEGEEYMSDIIDDTERVIEYDSEENEVEVKPQTAKKNQKVSDFFEQEAELTSEDEWVGSGDEDEVGLNHMEREEGDDETFNQNKLQRELGQIHMRNVLDQDKRDVRLLQEILFEDADLGTGSRQRKFRWKNPDGEEDTSIVPNELTDTQEEEFESEEQWRKQRHEREVFLRQMQKQEKCEEFCNININRTTIIKANLCSKTTPSLLLDVNATRVEKTKTPTIENETTKNIPYPKKAFHVHQQNYHGSFLTRGRGALARLAALATPLVGDGEEELKIGSFGTSNRKNFVFAAVSRNNVESKVIKRKADSNNDTPQLIKKTKYEENQKNSRISLLDHIT